MKGNFSCYFSVGLSAVRTSLVCRYFRATQFSYVVVVVVGIFEVDE